MKITIWDLDYYYAKDRTNCFNPDAMKISSYHKQLGDHINFVVKQDDIYRPYDLYYIIREKKSTPQPPAEFFLNSKVRWWGAAAKNRIRWKMPDTMLACRSDYLLYPDHNTKIEKSEHIRLFNNNAELLPKIQDWKNTFKNKYTIVTDPYMWYSDIESISQALDMLLEVKKISFLEPIWLKKLLSSEELKTKFLKLKFSPGSKVKWKEVDLEDVDLAINFIKEFKSTFPAVKTGVLHILYIKKTRSHWINKNYALEDLQAIMNLICKCKKEGIEIHTVLPLSRLQSSPYFFIFEEISNWTEHYFKNSWLEYLSMRFAANRTVDIKTYWRRPEKWDINFRDLLRQTWWNKEFLLHKWKNSFVSETDVPWQIWEEEFKYGI